MQRIRRPTIQSDDFVVIREAIPIRVRIGRVCEESVRRFAVPFFVVPQTVPIRIGGARRGDDRAVHELPINLRAERARRHFDVIGERVSVRIRKSRIGSVDRSLRAIAEPISVRVWIRRIRGRRARAGPQLEPV